MAIVKRVLAPDRVRRPPREGWSWIDRRFLREYSSRLSREAILLYFFLAAVGDSSDLSRDHQALLQEFLRQADLVKFAGLQPSSDDIEHSIGAARRFLDETQENAPLIDELMAKSD